jgi:hypothetical protein
MALNYNSSGGGGGVKKKKKKKTPIGIKGDACGWDDSQRTNGALLGGLRTEGRRMGTRVGRVGR